MPDTPTHTRREREIMDIVYRLGRATANDVLANLADPPSYSAVRALLKVLETKGHLKHRQDGPRYVYLPVVKRENARVSALTQVIRTFFDNSAAQAVAALIETEGGGLSKSELDELGKLINRARKEGR